MRTSLRALFAICLTPAFWPALSAAASIEMRGPDGRVQLHEAPAQVHSGPEEAGRIEQRYRAAYYYAVAQWALLQGLPQDAELLLRRAQEDDPASALLVRERGELLDSLGQDAQAAVLLDQAVRAEPEDLELRRRLARVYVRLQQLDLARGLFLGVDGAEPGDAERLRSLVGLDLQAEDLAAAERRLRALLRLGGDSADDELLGMVLQRQGKDDEARLAYRRALDRDPERSGAWSRLAASLDAAGDTVAALRALGLGLDHVPDSALLADQLGKLGYRLGLFDVSEAAYDRLLELDPADANSLLYRGLSRLKQRRYAEAEADFQALGGLRNDSPGQWYALALALSLQRKYAEAEAALKRSLELNPKAEPAWVQLALLHERQDRLDQAERTLKQARKALPASDELALLLAAVHERQGRRSAAGAVLHETVRKGAGAAVRFQLAVHLDQGGDFKRAEGVLEALIKDQPEHAQALNYLGYSWAERKQRLPEAEALIRRALELEPGNHYYLDSLGWALHQQARYQDAELVLARAAAAIPEGADAEEAVVLDHLAQTREALGRSAEAAEARARAAAIRAAAQAEPSGAAEGVEP
jgi:tetratricopeptide (TPR) repeat protein